MTIFQWVCIGLGIFLALPMIKKYLPVGKVTEAVSKAVKTKDKAATVDLTDYEETDAEWFELMKAFKKLRDCAMEEDCFEAVELLDQVFPKLNALSAKYPVAKAPTSVLQ